MREEFQRLLMMSEPQILPLNAQAALGAVRVPERSQFSHLLRHFLERFFNHETASPDGDAKTRMVQIAFAAGLPPFVVALYLFPVYHPFIAWPPGRPLAEITPSYWLQVNHHLFFVVYSFVAVGLATVFEWDLFFPDLLDIFVLTTLPIRESRLFLARVAAIAIFIGGFLLDANVAATFILPTSFDPPNLSRFLAGHVLSVALSGFFAAMFGLATQGALLAVLGERWFRKFSLALQGIGIAALLIVLLLFPVFSQTVPVLLQQGSRVALCFPPFWFLGVDQRLLEGPSALPIYHQLAAIALAATLAATLLAVITYPIAYRRRTRQLVQGASTRATRSLVAAPLDWLLNATLLRRPMRRAVFHFISRTILRVPRYRIYLVLYGGVGLSIVVAGVLRFTVVHGLVRIAISADGVRAAACIVAFWTIAGLRMAFVSSGNQHGNWIFFVTHGRPAGFSSSMDQFKAARLWALTAGIAITAVAGALLHLVAPAELRTWPSIAGQCLVAGGMCVLLADILFLNVTAIAFTGEPMRGRSGLALVMLKYFIFLPLVSWIPIVFESWVEGSLWRFSLALELILAAHIFLRSRHARIVKEHCSLPPVEFGEEDLPMTLGLRS